MTPRDPEALQVAFRVLKTLDELGVSYHLGGSYASAIHGIPRFRLGGGASDRQWSDVCGIVGVQAGNLDVAYLAQWADRVGIRDLLERVMGEV